MIKDYVGMRNHWLHFGLSYCATFPYRKNFHTGILHMHAYEYYAACISACSCQVWMAYIPTCSFPQQGLSIEEIWLHKWNLQQDVTFPWLQYPSGSSRPPPTVLCFCSAPNDISIFHCFCGGSNRPSLNQPGIIYFFECGEQDSFPLTFTNLSLCGPGVLWIKRRHYFACKQVGMQSLESIVSTENAALNIQVLDWGVL